MNERRAMILDTTAFIAGFNPSSIHNEIYSVPDVGRELTRNSMAKLRFNTAVKAGRLKLCEPRSQYLDEARKASMEVGDLLSLSEADMKILALAIQLKREGYSPIVITDDYSIQNVAKKLSVNYTSIAIFGIKFHLKWLLYCPACHRKYPPDYKSERCEICGTKLKRKPLSKSPT